jgi:hypothetical protein
LTYINNVLVHTGGHKDILQQLKGTLLRLRCFGLKMNAAKSIFRTSEVQYLRCTLRPEGVSPSKKKLGVLKAFFPPTSPKKFENSLVYETISDFSSTPSHGVQQHY